MIPTRTSLIKVSPIVSSESRKVAPVSVPREPWEMGDKDAQDRAAVLDYLRRTPRDISDGWRDKYYVRERCELGESRIAVHVLNNLVREGRVERMDNPGGHTLWRAKL